MNGSGSSSRCACPTTSSTRSSGGSVRSSQAFASSRASTCTSRSRSSATGRPASSKRSSACCATPQQGRGRSASRRAATARRGASACSSSTTTEGGGLLAGDVQERLERLGVYRREGRPWLPHLTVARWNVLLDGAVKERTPLPASERSQRRPRLRLEPPPVRTFVPSDAAAYLSRLHPDGAQYEVLESVALGG